MRNASEYECRGLWLSGPVTLNDTDEKEWLWTSKHEKVMTQGAWRDMYNGSGRQTKERWWHRMPKWAWKMALNAKTKNEDGSNRQTE